MVTGLEYSNPLEPCDQQSKFGANLKMSTEKSPTLIVDQRAHPSRVMNNRVNCENK